MDEESPPQQEGRDRETTDIAAAMEQEQVKKIKEVLEKMEPLPGKISNLLRKQRARRRLTATDDHVLRYCEFLQVELSDTVALLNLILSEPLRPDYADQDFVNWLDRSSVLASSTATSLFKSEQAASSRAAMKSLRELYWEYYFSREPNLFMVTEPSFRYKHILGDSDDGDRTSRTSCFAAQLHPYAAEAGGSVFLVGIEETMRNKQLRWFMADDGEPDKKTLKVMSMVGPVGVGKTTLAMVVYRQLQIEGRHHPRYKSMVGATVKVSQRPDMTELLKHILSQINKQETWPGFRYPLADIQPSQITSLQQEHELLAREVSQCLQYKR